MSIATKLKLAAAAAAVVGTGIVSAAPAHALLDVDQVNTYTNGNGVIGTVAWDSYYSGHAHLTLYNANDRYCVVDQDRVMRNGVWSAWSDTPYCLKTTYLIDRYVNYNGQRVNYFQFRTRPAYTSTWTTWTVSPGGA